MTQAAPRSFSAGQMLGPYELVEMIGRGGMGEVWSARDTRLDRMVALKFASSDFNDRFSREAHTIAALNHPNICTLFDVGPNFLVMELIEGRPLDQVIPKHGLRLNEALRYAVDIADAVAAAHAQGIIHRDLKPSNVMITPKGRVKVLDFGLAKLAAIAKGKDTDNATTIAPPVSGEGAIVGTVAYMSPEQAQGLPLDVRSDVFSFGVLLHEMLTGVKPFSGDTKAATLAAVINQEPRPAHELVSIPPELERLLTRSLRKDPNRRQQTMADLHVALVELKEESDSGRLSSTSGFAGPATRPARRMWTWIAGAVAVLLASIAAWWAASRREVPAAPQAHTTRATNYAGRQSQPALSPDGAQLAFVWDGDRLENEDIYVKAIGEPDALRLTTDSAADLWPTWSPDGKRLAFRRGDAVYTLAVLGGSERRIGSGLVMPDDIGQGQMSWSPDGQWMVVPTTTGLFVLPAEGGEARLATSAPDAGVLDANAALSPDGATLAFFRCQPVTSCRIFLQSLSSTGTPDGPPRRRFDQSFRSGGLVWSADGERVIFAGSPHGGGIGSIWQARTKTEEPPERLVASSQAMLTGISLAGSRLAFVTLLSGAQVWKASGGRPPEPLIRSAAFDFSATFSPDGKRVAFQSGRSGDGDHIFAANADGSGIVRLTGRDVAFAANPTWSPNGKWLTFSNQRSDGSYDVVVMESGGGPFRRLTTGNNNIRPVFSRDGRRVWYQSNRTGRPEIWSVPVEGGTETQFTSEARLVPKESPDGRTLFCLDTSGNLFARPIAGGPERQIASGLVVGYAVAEDGLYVVRRGKPATAFTLHFMDFSGERDRIVTELPGYWTPGGPSVSPDGRTILFSHYVPNSVIEIQSGIR